VFESPTGKLEDNPRGLLTTNSIKYGHNVRPCCNPGIARAGHERPLSCSAVKPAGSNQTLPNLRFMHAFTLWIKFRREIKIILKRQKCWWTKFRVIEFREFSTRSCPLNLGIYYMYSTTMRIVKKFYTDNKMYLFFWYRSRNMQR